MGGFRDRIFYYFLLHCDHHEGLVQVEYDGRWPKAFLHMSMLSGKLDRVVLDTSMFNSCRIHRPNIYIYSESAIRSRWVGSLGRKDIKGSTAEKWGHWHMHRSGET